MGQLRQLGRLWQIQRVARRYGLDQFLGRRPGKTFSEPAGLRLRQALEEMGPVFVKFGQALSTRPDVLPTEIARELAKLQDAVPPFPGSQARAMVEQALGGNLWEHFSEFESQPLASASVAQVHAARLRSATPDVPGQEVVVKVLRPDIAVQVRRDIDLLHAIAHWLERYWQHGKRLRIREIVEEYETIIFDELDLIREAANASQLRRNWLGSELIYHPVVFWDQTRDNVLVLERLHGIPIDEVAQLRARGVNFRVLAERGVEIFFKQVFRDNFFHADMHPGNIFVDTSQPEQPRYLALDFGIVGTLEPSDQRYLAENFLAFFSRDYRRVAELHVESGWVPPGTRVDEFEASIRSVCEPIFNKPLKDISFGMFLLRLFQTARRFDMVVQPQLVLLQKTLLNVEGLGRQLYPELDLWDTAKPIMEEWMRRRLHPATGLKSLRDQLPLIAEALPGLLQRATRDWPPEQLRRQSDELRLLRQDFARAARRSRWSTLGAACVVAAAVVQGLDGYAPQMIADMPLATWVFAGLAGLSFWRAGRRD